VNKSRRIFVIAQGLSCLLLTAFMGLLLGRSFEDLHPLGKLISPNSGIWRHQPTDDEAARRQLMIALKQKGIEDVTLTFDEDGVPHITAENDSSLYFAQGFVTAYFRLWQMDFLSRLTAGRAAELLGEKALPVDRFFRRMKLPGAAEASADLLVSDLATRDAVHAYVNGVNARIEQIEIESLPFEYRLFGTHPEPWTPERIAYLSKYMTWELTGYMYDYRYTKTKNKVSGEILELLFPRTSRFPATILGDDSYTSKNRSHVSEGRINSAKLVSDIDFKVPAEIQPEPHNGSNNWAINGRYTASGKALLSNDLHLSYTLPALWFPIHLASATHNVFGASLPGSPGVIVGFNDNVSWAVTNGTNDVLDWHSLRFRDEHHREYLFNGTWRPVVISEEKIWLPDGRFELIHTRETHFGPILFEEGDTKNIADTPSGLAIQWTGLVPSNELRTFLSLNRAASTSECLDALKGYVAPPQNFLCADKDGRISYRLSGVFPSRLHSDGRDVREAVGDADVWQGFLTAEESPQKDNVADYIITANQAPFNGDRQADFGWFFANPYRADTIRELIETEKKRGKIRPEDVVKMQADDQNKLTTQFRDWATKRLPADSGTIDIKSGQCWKEANLENWNGRHDRESKAATLTDVWLDQFEQLIWGTVIGSQREHFWPSRWRLMETVMNEESYTRLAGGKAVGEVLRESLRKACDELYESYQHLPGWSEYQITNIRHTGRIPGLGRKMVNAGGAADSVFANKGHHGPTWKMVVSMENPPRAWAMIPGGKNGDPSSLEYDGTLKEWGAGKMKRVHFKPRKGKK
jgi:penicillin G amidase